jgi:putative oxidoreductase
MEFLTNLHQLSDAGLLALRIALGAIFLAHGTQKWAMWKMQPSAQMPANMLTTIKFLSIVEPLGGLAVLVGFLTQFAAVGLGIVMIGAIGVKVRMMKEPFTAPGKTGWEFDFMILAGAIALLFFGAGSISLDRVLFGI